LRYLVGVLVLALLLMAVPGDKLPPLRSQASLPCVQLESQAWWSPSGISVPASVGRHIHLGTCFPVDQVIDGTLTLPVHVIIHVQTQPALVLARLRAMTETTVLYNVTKPLAIPLNAAGNGAADFTVSINLSGVPTGRHEIRLSAFVNNGDGTQQYNSTGWQVCVRACSPTYRSGQFVEARGYYTGRGYAVARLTSAFSTVRSGGTISVALKPGSSGLPTTFSGVYLDPNFHAGDAGITVATWTAAHTGQVRLPVLASGPHRLVLLSSDGKEAGVQVVWFTVP
jgi:hypothetical protein